MPDDPMMVFFDAKSVAPLLRASARAMAFDMNSSLEWKDEQTSVVANMGDKLLYGLFHCAHPISAMDGMLKREYVRGNAEVDINYKKVEIDTETNFNLFSANFARFAAQSPAQAIRYLDEKKTQIDRAYANVSYKFESARKIQSQVQHVLASAVDNTYRIKVAADVGMAVGLAFTPVWVAIPGGIFYVLATETAKTRIEVDLALGGLIGKTVSKKEVQENLAYTTTYAAGQGFAEELDKDADTVMEEAEKQAHKVEEKALEKIRQITEKAGGTLNREAQGGCPASREDVGGKGGCPNCKEYWRPNGGRRQGVQVRGNCRSVVLPKGRHL